MDLIIKLIWVLLGIQVQNMSKYNSQLGKMPKKRVQNVQEGETGRSTRECQSTLQ